MWLSLELAACYTSEGPSRGSTPQDSGEALTRGKREAQQGKAEMEAIPLGMWRNHSGLSTTAISIMGLER